MCKDKAALWKYKLFPKKCWKKESESQRPKTEQECVSLFVLFLKQRGSSHGYGIWAIRAVFDRVHQGDLAEYGCIPSSCCWKQNSRAAPGLAHVISTELLSTLLKFMKCLTQSCSPSRKSTGFCKPHLPLNLAVLLMARVSWFWVQLLSDWPWLVVPSCTGPLMGACWCLQGQDGHTVRPQWISANYCKWNLHSVEELVGI